MGTTNKLDPREPSHEFPNAWLLARDERDQGTREPLGLEESN